MKLETMIEDADSLDIPVIAQNLLRDILHLKGTRNLDASYEQEDDSWHLAIHWISDLRSKWIGVKYDSSTNFMSAETEDINYIRRAQYSEITCFIRENLS
tara:strand:+ start:144 stop:443 length:300 start_codon:yes stop_codon:yes gene_type:complete